MAPPWAHLTRERELIRADGPQSLGRVCVHDHQACQLPISSRLARRQADVLGEITEWIARQKQSRAVATSTTTNP